MRTPVKKSIKDRQIAGGTILTNEHHVIKAKNFAEDVYPRLAKEQYLRGEMISRLELEARCRKCPSLNKA